MNIFARVRGQAFLEGIAVPNEDFAYCLIVWPQCQREFEQSRFLLDSLLSFCQAHR